ncbi:MAG: hypothetical protein OQJ80_12100, partial [Kangiella sp.]|nr:hypothetical protein [Kangiella sp.]
TLESQPGEALFKKVGVELDVKDALDVSLQSHQSPAAFVVLLNTRPSSTVAGNTVNAPLRQKEDKVFGVIIAVRKANTRAISFTQIREQVINRLFGWKPESSNYEVLRMAGGNMLSVKNGVCWIEKFTTHNYRRSVN